MFNVRFYHSVLASGSFLYYKFPLNWILFDICTLIYSTILCALVLIASHHLPNLSSNLWYTG
jgi:hypothetical protein